MINAYPSVMAVNRYQTHKDYYRVSAVSAVSGGKSNTIRRILDLPYEELAYKQFAQSAAKDVAGFISSAQLVKNSAQSVNTRLAASSTGFNQSLASEDQSPPITETIQQFVDTYNNFQDQLGDAPDYISHGLLQGLEGVAKPFSLQALGITKQENGKLSLQADVLAGQVSQPASEVATSLNNLASLAGTMMNTISRLQQLPSASLFQLAESPLKPYGQYRSQLQAYLPIPMRGLLLDAKM
ncbi:hypothetical protein [Paenibacillus roseipurpureus]|uniref:Uncharacterized protein n=1 Tax=Paenibacillus roseopurpureus TaxID=2918901 RepID=A0AA96LQV3_9BACL|nr:hypothetical protein [Paenibacillus sp. MBLB1832]WNR45524.1 hypothetical protein MJB10_05305 [Paenibacillus sp. MBLB1832]